MSVQNCVRLIGNLAADPKIAALPEQQSSVANFRLITDESYKDKEGNKVDKSEGHNCVVFGKQADIIGQYVKKGSPLAVEGRLRNRKYQDKDGNDQYITEIVVDGFRLLGKKTEEEQPAGASGDAPSGGSDDSWPE